MPQEPVKKGTHLIHETGMRGVAADDQKGSFVAVRQNDGAFTTWTVGTFSRDILADLIESLDPRTPDDKKPIETDPQGRPIINPKEFGFDTPDDYWDRMRKLAGLPPKAPKK